MQREKQNLCKVKGKAMEEEWAATRKIVFGREENHFLYEGFSMEMCERSLKRKGKEVQSDYKASKRIKSEEGCSRSNDDDVQRLSLTKRIGLFQHCDKEEESNHYPRKRIKIDEGCSNSKSMFDYLLEAVSLFSAYEEEQNSLKSMHELRNNATVDDEEEEGHESGELLPREFQEKIQELNGCEVKFVTEKKLFSTDLNPKHARLSIPPTKIANKFLSETEESSLNESIKENGRLAGLSVTVLDPSLKEYKMCLKKWKMEKSSIYNLTKGWNQIVSQNHLQLHHTLQLWSFRVSSQLCFALVKI
ncbi:hypothetical protein VNO80_05405 [Phaseolus coccineus]|uniref:B3 domain-containing protein n=1 Tax=Phaseolus coccineus TaxID=3886 RepID=A0AAN9NJR9_PHACN